MFLKGDKFYYADREKGIPVKCTVLDCSHLPEIIAQREDTGAVFECKEGYYKIDEYDIACIDAQIKTERNGDKKVIKKVVMSENEVKLLKFIKNIKDDSIATLDNKSIKEKTDTILAMVEELLQYRDLGTAEELNIKIEELKRWHTDKIAQNVKNPFAYTSTLICHNCDHKDDYIEELEAEVEAYRAIGTLEECRDAMAKQTAKKMGSG